MTDIGMDIATAIKAHIKALRLLKRDYTSVWAVADALGLPPAIVERAFSEFKFTGAKLDPRRQVTKVKPQWSTVIDLKNRR